MRSRGGIVGPLFGGMWRVPVLVALAVAAMLVQAAPAGAAFRHGTPRAGRNIRAGTQLVLSGLGPGTNVSGFIADTTNPFDPAHTTYPSFPAGTPPSGFTSQNEDFAGIIHAKPPGGGAEESLYCIDIRTLTYIGYGYVLGTWDAANVPNVGFVARLLNGYYPNTNLPAALTDLNQKAAAVQAAIWYFSDKYVLTATDPLHGAVAGIVAAVQAAGPLVEPPPPTLTITPSDRSGPFDSVLGPFTVATSSSGRRHTRHRRRPRGSGPSATVTITGATMYSNAAGTTPIANGATVPDGQQIWLRSAGPSNAVLEATAVATVPSGNVYLYDGGPDQAQKLILAQPATLTSTVSATAEFRPVGSLKVNKIIAGPAAGSRGQVVIHVACDDGVNRPDFTIPAASGSMSKTYDDIVAGTHCTVTETSNGSTTSVRVDVTVAPDGGQVTISSGGSVTVTFTDTYNFVPGSLIVRKTIAGPAAGQQGAVTIHTVCNGIALTPDFVIAAGAPAGSRTMQYDEIPAPATCTVTETADGHTSTVSVVVEGSGQTVSVPAGRIATADIADTYGLVPGQLEVTKTIAGPQAGQQGQVVIHTVCTPAPAAGTPDFMIPAGATGDRSQLYSGIPAGAGCVVTETADGATSSVSAVVTGSPDTVTIPAGGSGAAHITDTYGAVPGSLLVTKTITGPVAGQQGPVTIHVVCNGTSLSPDWVIPAGTPAGNVSHSFDGIPAGSVCTVGETTDGTTATVTAAVSGNGQSVTVPAGTVVSMSLTDAYQGAPGSLIVTKKFTGSGAHQHGRAAILVACGGPVHRFAFVIPAHTSGSVSRRFDGLPAGARCTVFEVAVGRTARVSVVAIGKRQEATIPANGVATLHITDKFSVKAITVTRPPAVTG
jgi:Domain of unknown function (DUF5979)/Thioester domain